MPIDEQNLGKSVKAITSRSIWQFVQESIYSLPYPIKVRYGSSVRFCDRERSVSTAISALDVSVTVSALDCIEINFGSLNHWFTDPHF
jgi:hypothetical protein